MEHPRGNKLYRFDMSLMERLATSGLPMSRIDVQRRMRPTISSLIRCVFRLFLLTFPENGNGQEHTVRGIAGPPVGPILPRRSWYGEEPVLCHAQSQGERWDGRYGEQIQCVRGEEAVRFFGPRTGHSLVHPEFKVEMIRDLVLYLLR